MAKSEKKKTSLSHIAGQVGFLLVGGYLVLGILFNQVQITEKQQELEAARAKLAVQQQQNDELSRVLESGSDLEIIERVARDKLGYARPNERVFVDVNGQ